VQSASDYRCMRAGFRPRLKGIREGFRAFFWRPIRPRNGPSAAAQPQDALGEDGGDGAPALLR
ncbi:MAG: hypothetical protein U1E27_11515, partial [Kiritimatiellia bacterium]|nr:hypothetical protein [Kiritimatiellia bacterium]